MKLKLLDKGETIRDFCRNAILQQFDCGTIATLLFAGLLLVGFISQLPCVRYPLADACVDGHYVPVDEQNRTESQRTIMQLWSISESEVEKPVNLWSK